MHRISETIDRKFIDQVDLDDWLIETDTGWQPCTRVLKTVEYQIYELTLENGFTLSCADTHIVFDQDFNEIFVKDLSIGDLVVTKDGPIPVKSLVITENYDNMYDLTVDSVDHRYYANGILNHNTTTAVGYLLWYAMFNTDSTILVAANKFTAAQEIMTRVRYAYETCPDFIRAGIKIYNKQSIEFENGSRIVCQTTNPTTGRGMSIALLYCLDGDTTVRIRHKETLIEEDISLSMLYSRLHSSAKIIT